MYVQTQVRKLQLRSYSWAARGPAHGVAPHTPWEGGPAEEDPAHYTNRSPYPLVHLLRQASVSTAAQSYKGSRSVSETNELLLRDLGTAELERLRTAGRH